MVVVVVQQIRKRVIEEAISAVDAHAERREIPWRGGKRSLPFVQIPVTHAVLNPRSHRIQAQVRSAAARADLMTSDPFGPAAQDLIAEIIRKTPGYARIRSLLSREPQKEPGLVTTAGVMINANTRLVALRELGFDYITVQVLPPDATELELAEIELSLQMEVESKQPYSFTNQLLFIRDLLRIHPPVTVGLKLDPALDGTKETDRKKAASEVETSARLLNLIETVLADSKGTLTYEWFDGEQQNLKDIDQAFEAQVRKGNSQTAERVRLAKITGMLAGLDYRKVRQIDETLLAEYTIGALGEQEWLKDHVALLASGNVAVASPDDLVGLDILDDLGDFVPESDVVTLAPVYHALAATPEDGEVELSANAEGIPLKMAKAGFRNSIRNALATAVDNKEQDNRFGDGLESPIRRLQQATRACDQVRDSLGRVPDRTQIDLAKLTSALEDFERAHDEMIMVLSRFDIKIDESDPV